MKKYINNLNEFNVKEDIKVRNEPFNIILWLLKVLVIIISITVALIIIYLLVPNKIKFYCKYKINKLYIKDEYQNKFDEQTFISAINSNNNLNDEEKEFIKNYLKDELIENEKYIDLNKAYRKIAGLKVKRIKSDTEFDIRYQMEMNNQVVGDYSPIYNEIVLYDFPEYKAYNNIQDGIVLHEINHVLTDYNITSASNSACKKIDNSRRKNGIFKKFYYDYIIIHKNLFTETANELFTREYLGAKNDTKLGIRSTPAYNKIMSANYILAEILDEETIRKYKFDDNIAIIIDDLLSINNNFDEVFDMISNINKLNTDLYELTDEEIKECNDEIYDALAYFYKAKFKEDMDNDLNILCYGMTTVYRKSDKLNKIYDDLLHLDRSKGDKIIDIFPKGYISKEYKEKNPYVEIYYEKDGIKQSYIIENKYLK